jgi:multiple sugar transport system substrate-binding protein
MKRYLLSQLVKKILLWSLVLVFVLAFVAMASAEKVEITYWQYFYETKKETIDVLIDLFQKENPDIIVNQITFPYEDYNVKVAASVPAGVGPNVVNLYYGWLPLYINAGYLQALPEDAFNPEMIEKDFFPLVSAAKVDGKYYALPTAVRSLALIWNKDLFKKAGLDPEIPPKTLDELVEYAQKLTIYDKAGNLVEEGLTAELRGQLHHWVREILIRQFGGKPYSDDNRKVTYNDQSGYDALTFFTDLTEKYKVGQPGFLTDDVTAFKAGKAAMTIDGSFRIGTLDKLENLHYGIAEVPSHNGIKSNFASFWANGITSFTEGEQLEASIKFLKFLTSDNTMELWLKNIGELPAKPSVAFKEENINDPKYGPFIKGLEYAHATYFVDEMSQRQAWIDAYDLVILEGKTVKEAVDKVATIEQMVLDKFYSDK